MKLVQNVMANDLLSSKYIPLLESCKLRILVQDASELGKFTKKMERSFEIID
jgi:hypothetical protein